MNTLAQVVYYEILVFMTGLALIVIYQVLNGTINVNGLLRDKGGDRGFSPGRLQLLVLTILSASYYFLLVLDNPGSAKFPPIPAELLLVLGGSNSFFLASKLYSLFRDRGDSFLSRSRTNHGWWSFPPTK